MADTTSSNTQQGAASEADSANQVVELFESLKERGGVIGAIAGILAPGVGPGVILVICTCLVVFISMCAFAAMAGLFSIHMFVLIFLASGLMASVLWSYSLRKSQLRQMAQAETEGGGDDATGTTTSNKKDD